MDFKRIFLALGFFVSLAIGCNVVDTTPTPLPTITTVPIETLLFLSSTPTYAYPTLTPVPTDIPYPTASVVKANAVAFATGWDGDGYSLWVANVDGSGEKKLTHIANKDSLTSILLQWSPNGEWISYRGDDGFWVISRDGLVNKRLLPLPDKSVGYLIRYAWSPDSSQIAYLEALSENSTVTPNVTPTPGPYTSPYRVGMIDIAVGNISELFSIDANAGYPFLLWSQNGHELLFIKEFSVVLFDVTARRVVKEMKRGCGIERNMSLSPNGQWYSYTDNGVGRYFTQWICVGGLDSLPQVIQVDGTTSTPVWDKTGIFLYFVARRTNPDGDPNLRIDERLMRYDVRTQKTERLLSLREQQTYDYIQSISISPDGNTLMLQSKSSQTKLDLIFVDIKSLTTTQLSVDFGPLPNNSYPHIETYGWSPDGKNIIFFFTKFHQIDRTTGSVHYGYFYALDIRTGKISVFSGIHQTVNVQVFPIATSP